MYLAPGPGKRFSAVVGRRTGRSHIRNRLKRRAREVFRRSAGELDECCCVVIFKPGSDGYSYEDIEDKMRLLWKRAGLLKE